jgi:hypothetical protein
MKRRLSSVKERRDMRFADQPPHDGSILYVSNLLVRLRRFSSATDAPLDLPAAS